MINAAKGGHVFMVPRPQGAFSSVHVPSIPIHARTLVWFCQQFRNRKSVEKQCMIGHFICIVLVYSW